MVFSGYSDFLHHYVCQDITDILLKVVLSTLTSKNIWFNWDLFRFHSYLIFVCPVMFKWDMLWYCIACLNTSCEKYFFINMTQANSSLAALTFKLTRLLGMLVLSLTVYILLEDFHFGTMQTYGTLSHEKLSVVNMSHVSQLRLCLGQYCSNFTRILRMVA